MTNSRPLKVAIVAGEESGDLLGADLVHALSAATGAPVELVGVGGRHLEALGLHSLFDASEIALVGIAAIVARLPGLLRRIGQTADAVVRANPDCLITIDSPEFSLRVARKVRAADPGIPIVHYVCPSVWAWRPARAPAMAAHVDRVLCLLPFEAAALEALKGPPGTYVGHRLVRDAGVLRAAAMQADRATVDEKRPRRLLLLPGSRRSEVSKLLPDFGRTVDLLRQRGHELELSLPTVPHVEGLVREQVSTWDRPPAILLGPEEKWTAFGRADAALIASGTVSLELALAGVPLVSCYRLDPLARLVGRLMLTTWSALLPNLITDRQIAPEIYNEYVRPPLLARHLEALLFDTSARRWQVDGFAEVRRRMATQRPAGEIAAEAVLEIVRQ